MSKKSWCDCLFPRSLGHANLRRRERLGRTESVLSWCLLQRRKGLGFTPGVAGESRQEKQVGLHFSGGGGGAHVHAQLCLTLCDPVDCSPPGSSVRVISQARILEWLAIPYSGGSSQPRDRTCVSCVSCIAGGFFTADPVGKPPGERGCHPQQNPELADFGSAFTLSALGFPACCRRSLSHV